MHRRYDPFIRECVANILPCGLHFHDINGCLADGSLFHCHSNSQASSLQTEFHILFRIAFPIPR